MMKYPPGVYKADMKINAKPDPSCDPSVQPCEKWLPGTYTVQTGNAISFNLQRNRWVKML